MFFVKLNVSSLEHIGGGEWGKRGKNVNEEWRDDYHLYGSGRHILS